MTCAFVTAAGCAFAAGLCAGSVFFTTFAFAADGFALCAAEPLAGLRAVLLVVLVGICENFAHGSNALSGAIFFGISFSMHGLVNLLCFAFFDAENIHKIRNVRVAQTFEIRETSFHQRDCLLFGNRQGRR